ncbi:MAG: potassium transporter Kup [Gemmatimonadaceae bacterium]|nr:potassium transporter Kup [Gemmatimonadaceae bacterium]
MVYGDIGTSPLYALRECFKPEYGLAPTPDNVYGVLSLILWSLIIVVGVKYIAFVMRADNRGEGGILALVALILQRKHRESERMVKMAVIVIGLVGAALLYGDGVITPAMSILSATEGLSVITPVLSHLSVPLTVIIIIGLFSMQRHGTAGIGRIFGPVTLVWFTVIGGLGVMEIVKEPEILYAVNPMYGFEFFRIHGTHSFVVLGAVVLAVTGAEALYADMGHFGKRAIRLAFFAVVLPSLVLNYFGQGGLILHDPATAENPFYLLAPRMMLYPLVALATMAAVIASQAMISGAFSLTQQCVQLGYSPRVTIRHTSESEAGQIYIPEVNGALAIGCLIAVLLFRTSTALGAAYGIAVTGTFLMTTVLLFVVARTWWNWSLWKAGLLTGILFIVDLSFFGANVLKIPQGGWFPLVIAFIIFTAMTTWARGRALLIEKQSSGGLTMEEFIESIARKQPARVSGLAVFLARDPTKVPSVLLHHLKHNKVLHQKVVILSVLSEEVPTVPDEDRIKIEPLRDGFYRILARYGFMETPKIPDIMKRASASGIHASKAETTYYLGREELIPSSEGSVVWRWRKKLFRFMSRNATSPTKYFDLPPNRVVELGAQIEF